MGQILEIRSFSQNERVRDAYEARKHFGRDKADDDVAHSFRQAFFTCRRTCLLFKPVVDNSDIHTQSQS
jgi:hypothetical protein